MLKAVFYSAIIYLMIDQAEMLIINIAGIVNFIALTVLGVVNFSPLTGIAASELANSRIIEVSNTIFKVYIEDPWTFGQFGVIKDLPVVTNAEKSVLPFSSIVSNMPWNEVFLQYPSGSEERKVIVEVLLDDSILHSDNLDTTMLVQGGASRTIIALLALGLNVTGLVLFGAIGAIQYISTIGIAIITGFLPILMVASFFGHIGEKWLKAGAVIWIYVAALKIAAALYIGIPMMVFRLIPADGVWYMITVAVHLIINGLSVFFLPKIFTTMVPAMLRGALKVTSAIGNARNRMVDLATGRGRRYRTSPARMTSEFRRGKFAWGQEERARGGSSRRASRSVQTAAAQSNSKPEKPASPRPRRIDRTPDRKEDHISRFGHNFKMQNGILVPENPRKPPVDEEQQKRINREAEEKAKQEQLEKVRRLSGHFMEQGLVDEAHLKHLEEFKKDLVDTMEDIEQDRQTQRIYDKVEHAAEKRETRKRMENLERKIDVKRNTSDREMRGPSRSF